MKKYIQLMACLLICKFVLGTGVVLSQDSDDAKQAPSPTGFEYLKQLEGKWLAESKNVSEGEGSGTLNRGLLNARLLGENWLVNEYDASVGEFKFKAIQTIQFDKEKNAYSGNWIDSITNFKWDYSGKLEGKRLTLSATGPDMKDPSKTQNFRDIFEFVSPNEFKTFSQMQNAEGKWETMMEGTLKKPAAASNKTTVTPFIMFQGKKAESAINFYKTVFAGTNVVSMTKYAAGDPAGKEGTVKIAEIEIAGQRVKFIDSPPVHDFNLTPSFSLFVECENESQLKDRFTKLSKGGKVMMPLNNYGFSKQFGWVVDEFGVSWQVNLQ